MLGLFGTRLSAQTKAAKSARSMRQLAAREFTIELRLLIGAIAWATEKRNTAYRSGEGDKAGALTLALGDAQDLVDRLGYSTDPLVLDLEKRWRSAHSSDDYEALATYENEIRETLIKLREQAKSHLNSINLAATR